MTEYSLKRYLNAGIVTLIGDRLRFSNLLYILVCRATICQNSPIGCVNQRVGPHISQGKSEFLGFLEVDCSILRRNPLSPPKIYNLSTSHHSQIVDWRRRRLVRQKFADLHPTSQRLARIVSTNPNRSTHILLGRFEIFTSLL